MTNEDEKLICDYMGWWSENFYISPSNPSMLAYCRERIDDIEPYYIVAFDLNDASLCVQEMQKRGEWDEFLQHCYIHTPAEDDFIAHLFNSENFFKAFVEWRKGK